MPQSRFLGWALLLLPALLYAQNKNDEVEGMVMEQVNDQHTALVGANVYWLGTTNGVATDANGNFRLLRVEGTNKLIVSFVGYRSDTLDTEGKRFLHVVLRNATQLNEVEVVEHRKTTEVSYFETRNVQQISGKELLKAACCTLSESFETSPSVDVSFTDAVTGTRQIQLLGLAGPYTMITRENMPDIRGLSSIYGLTYVPGTWIESIQLMKGIGSVINGYESIAGQINLELKKPETSERFFVNGYGNEAGRLEANIHLGHKINDKWSTLLLFSGRDTETRRDRNNDGFMDMPVGSQYEVLNRWKYAGANGIQMQFGVKVTDISDVGGQVDFNPSTDAGTTRLWGMEMQTHRLEGWTKIGQVYADKPWKSMGLQLAAVHHNQQNYFGLNNYDATEDSFYANYIYQSMISNTNHKFITGADVQYDGYKERLNAGVFDRTEMVPGVFAEYDYTYLDKFSVVAGIRADHHNLDGTFVTPRLHMRYAITDNTVLRVSAGRGERTANIISENIGLLASSRQWIIQGDGSKKPFGLKPEVAWNYGLSLTQDFNLDYRDGAVSLDFFRTDFINQVVVDLDQNPHQAVFHNLDGQSFANSFQAQVDYEVIKRVDVRVAYRKYNVKTTYDGRLLEKPLLAEDRAFINAAFASRKHWNIDWTVNWQGPKRIPSTQSNPLPYRMPDSSPDYFTVNLQLSKTWRERFDLYTGVENLFNYRQARPILSSENPFGPNFDSSLVWGPIFGRSVYAGFRYKLK